MTLTTRLARLEATPWGEGARGAQFEGYRDDPVGFVREVLAGDPWGKQEEILRALAVHPRVTVRSCHSSGKTWLAARAVLWWLETRPGAICVTTAPTWHQVRDLLWREIRSAFVGARGRLKGTCHQTELDIAERWFARGLSTNEPVNFQGFHSPHLLFVADEASGIAPAIFEAAQGFLTQEGARVLLIGNPNFASGPFFESHRQPGFARFHISAADTPEWLVSRGWIAEREAEWGQDSPAFQTRVLGEFPTQGADSLIDLAWVTAAMARDLTPCGPVTLGVDVARYGNDSSVCYARQGPCVLAMDEWRGSDLMTSAGRVAAMAREFGRAAIQVDEIGVGAGLLDRLKEAGLPATGVNVSQAAQDPEHYFNRRSELFFALRERFRHGDIDVATEDTALLAELTSLRFSYTPRGQLRLEGKDDLKKRGLPSPDHADALMLAFAPPVSSWSGVNTLIGLGVSGWNPRPRPF